MLTPEDLDLSLPSGAFGRTSGWPWLQGFLAASRLWNRLIDFCSQDRLCPGVTGKVLAAGPPFASPLPPLL